MAKYRLLTQDELSHLEQDFIKYLILNGITAEDWERLKQDSPEEAQGITDLFSDVVFEKILRKISFLDRIEPNAIYCFQCLEKSIVLIGLQGDGTQDLTKVALDKMDFSGLKVYTQSRDYRTSREKELFEMIEKGCQISEGQLFKSLSLLL